MEHQLSDDHFCLFAAMISGQPAGRFENEVPERGRQIFPAQSWKDWVCAKIIVELLKVNQAMVVAGCGHTDYGLGIPQRVRALGSAAGAIITTREMGEPVTRWFRKHEVADLVISYEPKP